MTGYEGLRGAALREAACDRGLPYYGLIRRGVAAVREAVAKWDQAYPRALVTVPAGMDAWAVYDNIMDQVDETGLVETYWWDVRQGEVDDFVIRFTGPAPEVGGGWGGILDPQAYARWLVQDAIDDYHDTPRARAGYHRTAVHEAGHGVVGIAHPECVTVDLWVERVGGGNCRAFGADGPALSLAGAVAELLKDGVEPTLEALQGHRDWSPRGSWGSDLDKLRDMPTCDLEASIAEATGILKSRWDLVEKLAGMMIDEMEANPKAEAVKLWQNDYRGMVMPEGWSAVPVSTGCYSIEPEEEETAASAA